MKFSINKLQVEWKLLKRATLYFFFCCSFFFFHFFWILQVVDEISDQRAASQMGIAEKGQVILMIHFFVVLFFFLHFFLNFLGGRRDLRSTSCQSNGHSRKGPSCSYDSLWQSRFLIFLFPTHFPLFGQRVLKLKNSLSNKSKKVEASMFWENKNFSPFLGQKAAKSSCV